MAINSRSVEVYREKVHPNIKKRHEKVLNAIKFLQPCTSLDVADFLNVPLHSISGRFSELSGNKEYGRPMIECVGERKNRCKHHYICFVIHSVEVEIIRMV